MSTIALSSPAVPALPTRVKVAGALALPLGLMTCVGVVVFFELSWLTWVSVWGALQGGAALAGGVQILRGRPGGVRLLRISLVSQMVFTVMKLVAWQEAEAALFGALALVLYVLVRERR